jgi:hypothetical protein
VVSPPVYANGGKIAIDAMDAATCDLLFVDELGPLEFRGEGGFVHGFAAIEARRYLLAIVVIRPELLKDAMVRWP